MITVRRANERGHVNHGWLDTYHTFSFGRYVDPAHMGFRALRVMNEDRVAPGAGFGEHGHRDMEIVTVVLDGALAHRDSLGSGSALRYGDVQYMRAGSGIRHSEFNASDTEPVHFYQIWLEPTTPGGEPAYAEAHFAPAERAGRWQLVAVPTGDDGSLAIGQDARVYLGRPNGTPQHLPLARGRHAWVQVLRGAATVNGTALATGDGAALSEEEVVTVTGDAADAEVLVFDLA